MSANETLNVERDQIVKDQRKKNHQNNTTRQRTRERESVCEWIRITKEEHCYFSLFRIRSRAFFISLLKLSFILIFFLYKTNCEKRPICEHVCDRKVDVGSEDYLLLAA